MHVRFVPRHDEHAEVTGFFAAAVDMSELRSLEKESLERAEQYRRVGESITFGVWITDSDGKLQFVSQSFLDMLGISAVDAMGLGWVSKLEDGTAQDTVEAWDRCREEGTAWEREHRFIGKDGRRYDVLALGRPVRNKAGQITSWAGLNIDITDRKREQERLSLISAELDHRVKNILATVSTIARMTGRSAESLEEHIEAFQNRIQALASAHQQLASARWRGLSFKNLVSTEVEPYRAETSKVIIRGPDVMLRPNAAQALALAIHELATNAAKYGAFSKEQGSTVVEWNWNKAGGLNFSWREVGLSNLKQPKRTGFGASVIEKITAGQLKTTSKMTFHSDGIEVTLFIPPTAILDETLHEGIDTGR